MMLQELHAHTCYCDGKNTPEEMVLAAIQKGFRQLGFSGHSYTFFDESWCMSPEGTEAYVREIRRLKKVYAGKINILCGLEKDFYSTVPTDDFDYVIGSVHYLKIGDDYIPIDESADILLKAAEKYFGGDMYALCECYFQTVAKVVEQTGADIIGHFDLITKFNEGGALFNEGNERYVRAWQQSADRLLESGALFEINTGAIARGYRSSAYPSAAIAAYLMERGAVFILSGDAHSTEGIGYRFEDYAPFASEALFVPRRRKE